MPGLTTPTVNSATADVDAVSALCAKGSSDVVEPDSFVQVPRQSAPTREIGVAATAEVYRADIVSRVVSLMMLYSITLESDWPQPAPSAFTHE